MQLVPAVRVILCVIALAWLVPRAAGAQGFVSLTGSVVDGAGTSVSGAHVVLTGNNATFERTSDAHGHFAFSGLEAGEYVVRADAKGARGAVSVELNSQGASITVRILATIGSVTSARAAVDRNGGTDVALSRTFLQRMPSQGSISEVLLQLPDSARGANGVVHINGDHGDINYIVDGVSVPQELNRNIGAEFDPQNLSYFDAIEGAYPAQYGLRFGAIVNISTTVGQGEPGASGYLHAGSFNTYDSSIGYHTHAGAGTLVMNLRAEHGDRFLDPPNFTAVHDEGSNTNEFLRYTVARGNDYANLSVSHAYQVFQIPNDVEGGEPAATDDNETQDDTFVALQFHHALKTNGSLNYGLGYKQSRIRDTGDPADDFAYGEALNLAGGGAPDDCANGIVSACAYSLFADRTARDLTFNADELVQSTKHAVRFGALYDIAAVQKRYDVTLQPGNFLAPLLTPGSPSAAYTVEDHDPNSGHTESLYVQDSWNLGRSWLLDYGLRADAFQISSDQFGRGFAQVSPRLKLTRIYSPRGSAYIYYGRFFEPFSFENVSPAAAHLLNLPEQPAPAQFDLLPERDTDVEIGGHLPLGDGDLGLRITQRIATHLIDDTQVGVTALHEDINYARGNISTQSLYYQHPLASAGRAYLSFSHTRTANQGCETQLLAPCFGSPTDFTPADHDQSYDASGGVLLNDTHGGWIGIDGEYGSGLSSTYCEPQDDNCKVPPHTTFDLEKGIGLAHGNALTLRMRNVLNDRYRITFENAQGNHSAAGRTLEVGWQFGASK